MSAAGPTLPKADSAPARGTIRRHLTDPIWMVVAGVIAMFVLVNGLMFWLSLEARPELVRQDYYDASKRYEGVIAARAASTATGWRVAIAPAGTGVARVTVSDPQGRPVTGVTGTALAYRPADHLLDQPLGWAAQPGTPGGYEVRFARPAAGLWHLTLDLEHGGERFEQTFRYVAP